MIYPHIKIRWSAAVLAAAFALAALPGAQASARDVHVSPIGAPPVADPDGSRERPWPKLYIALRNGDLRPGDRLVLGAGEHGDLQLNGVNGRGRLSIVGDPDGRAHVDTIEIKASKDIFVSDLAVWPRDPAAMSAERPKRPVVSVSKSSGVRLENLDIRSGADARNYVVWTKEQWQGPYAIDGVSIRGGGDNALRNSRLRGVRHAVFIRSPNALVENNIVEGFSGDGLRGIADFGVFRGNIVKNCVKVSKNHDDGFQSWSRGADGKVGSGEVKGVVLERNSFFEWEGNLAHPLRCKLQGIGLFDGAYRNWTIQNNLVVTRHWHGITVFGPIGVLVVNNTVVHPNGRKGGRPWISLQKTKDGRPPENTIVANNIAHRFKIDASPGAVAQKNNLKLEKPRRTFADIRRGDFTLSAQSDAIDQGHPMLGAKTDITGAPRTDGRPDIGAFER